MAETVNLVFDYFTAHNAGETRHAERVMADLGIRYEHATPQSIVDAWWFWRCSNVPDPLPPYLRRLNVHPREAVGYGLTPEQAARLERSDGAVDSSLSRQSMTVRQPHGTLLRITAFMEDGAVVVDVEAVKEEPGMAYVEPPKRITIKP